MKIDYLAQDKPWPQPVAAVAPVSSFVIGVEPAGFPSPISNSLGRLQPVRQTIRRSMRLTERDCQIIDLICRTRALRDDQIQTALFGPGGRSRCQLRLTLLVRNQYLDRLSRRAMTAPAVYVLSRRSIKGNRMMRERLGEAEFRRLMVHLGPLEHLLAVNHVRVRMERACRDLGWSIKQWQHPQDLALLLRSLRLVPDAYFQVQRLVDGQVRTASFFLEMEVASKSSQVLRSKLMRYMELYYSGQYERLFATRGLRLLVVFANQDEGASSRRIERAMQDASRIGVTIARFAALTQLKASNPVAGLTDTLWSEPGNPKPVRLFSN